MSADHPSHRRRDNSWPLEALERRYDEAVRDGTDMTGGRDVDDRHAAPLELMASSTIHVPHLVLLMAVLEDVGPDDDDAGVTSVASDARRCSAGLMALGQRALLAHARRRWTARPSRCGRRNSSERSRC